MKNSFLYIFKEKAFLKHFFMLFAFVLTSNIMINLSSVLDSVTGQHSTWYYLTLLLGYIIMFVPYGYSMEMLKSNLLNKGDIIEMDVAQNFKEGFKVTVSGILLVIMLTIVLVVLGIVNRIFITKFGYIGTAFVLTFVFLILLIISFLMIAMCCRYVIKPTWSNFVNFPAVCKLINNNVLKYSKVYGLSALSIVLLFIITGLSASIFEQIGFIGFILYNVVISMYWTYLTFVYAKLFSFALDVDKIQ